VFEILRYLTGTKRDVLGEWLLSLRDRSAVARIYNRLDRVALGNFGDSKPVGGGVHELRIAYGPGYRVYFGIDGEVCVLLLCGGEKRTQSRDIEAAAEYWQDYKTRKRDKEMRDKQ
jgi:putative addiction module killer protein